jgi:hydroxymethylpyrimidine pyrophosphatase-like HAD family hydrolase
MIKLVLIDVDGTLYSASGVHPRVWDAADRARARGIHLAVCTGRSGAGVALGYAQRLDAAGLHIFDSGAVIVGGDGAVRRAAILDRALYDSVVAVALAEDLELELYTAEGGFHVRREPPDIVTHQKILGRKASVIDLRRPVGTPVRVQFVTHDGPSWQRARAATLALPGVDMHEATSPNLPGVIFASVTAHGVSKLSAAHWVAGQYGLADLSHVAMAGDGDNDLELIRAAGLGIAMGNAPAHVQAAAERVVGHVVDAGRADALDTL